MSDRDLDGLISILQAVGMAAAGDQPLDLDALATEVDRPPSELAALLQIADETGLVIQQDEVPRLSPDLTRSGSQFLQRKGEVADEVLGFLPKVIDDLTGREALLRGGSLLVNEFGYQVVHGGAVPHARSLVPKGFEQAVDEQLAVSLFAAAVALVVRLSHEQAPGCVAEEVLAMALLDLASGWIDLDHDEGRISEDDAGSALGSLEGIFDLLGDDDVHRLFEMGEPADAALAAQSPLDRQAGIVDQRIEAWFRPFGGLPGTGHLDERD